MAECGLNGRFFGAFPRKDMTDKKEPRSSGKPAAAKRNDDERKLLAQHPFESMSQVQNRYGKGRRKSGSDGGHQDGRGSNH